MLPYLGVVLCWLFAIYGFANGVYALRDPYGWLRAKWTATRGYDLNADPPPSTGEIRGNGTCSLFIAIVATWVATKITLRVILMSYPS
jgi:hypothetical protein